MAASDTYSVSSAPVKNCFKVNDKCAKCKRIVKNGILCDICDRWWHFKCGELNNYEEIDKDEDWFCKSCTDNGGYDVSTDDDENVCNILEIVNILQKDMETLKIENSALRMKVKTLEEERSTKLGEQNEQMHFEVSNSHIKTIPQRGWEAIKHTRRNVHNHLRKMDDDFPPLKNRFTPLFQCEDEVDSNCSPMPNQVKSKPRPTTCSSIQKIKKPKVLLYSDSYGKGLSSKLNLMNNMQRFSISGSVKPSACFEDVVSSVVEDAKKLSSQDMVVLLAGGNDVSRNNTTEATSRLKKTLAALTHTNVTVVNIPHRHDLAAWSCVNEEVERANEQYKNICKFFKNVSVVNVSTSDRNFHTKHGQHFNNAGKNRLSLVISKVVNDRVKNSVPIALTFKDSSSFLG